MKKTPDSPISKISETGININTSHIRIDQSRVLVYPIPTRNN